MTVTEILLRICSVALVINFLYELLFGKADTHQIILAAVFAAWADILKGQRQ